MILSSLVSRSSNSLIQYLSTVKPDPDAVLLFSLSAHAHNLEAIISRLRSSARHSVGCLSAPLPGASGAVVCSTAFFPSKDCIPFRSEIPGRSPIQVGRWNRQISNVRLNEQPNITNNSSSLPWGSFATAEGDHQPPVELGNGSLGDKSTLLFFTDSAPEGLSLSLDSIPHADKLGLIASSTPFITGRPFSLFYDDQVFSSGAVGVRLPCHFRPTSSVNFHGLVPLSSPVKVLKSEGNLIHALDHSNPSELIVEALRKDGRIKQRDERFFLGHLSQAPDGQGTRIKKVYSIVSGGPPRGFIALDADSAPGKGEMVQFFHQTPNRSSVALESLKMEACHDPTFHFLCAADDDIVPYDDGSKQEAVQIFRNVFLVASENGFLCTTGVPPKSLWKCVVPGGIGSLTWKDNKPV